MSVRRAIVDADTSTMNVRAFCAQHGVSTWFFYDLRRRHGAGQAVLEPRSRAPKAVPNRTGNDLEDEIVRARKQLEDAGLDNGPFSIQDRLGDMGLRSPSVATIWRVLSRRGLIEPDPSKKPKRAVRRFVAERANECWQIDATHWHLADGSWVEIINVIDDCSRVLIASVAVTTCTAAGAFAAIAAGAARWGLPERVLSDNGSPFVALRPGLHDLGVATTTSRPYHPQTCGKVERFHQTLKLRLAIRPAETLEELQAELDVFIRIYNYERRHRGIGRRTPNSVWESTPRSGPSDRPVGTPTKVSSSTVTEGRAWVGDNVISVGARHNGAALTALRTGAHIHLFVGGRLVRNITIVDGQKRYPLA
jgi:hypothetical protein